MLWHSFGTIAALLQEIVHIYPAINPAHLSVCIVPPVCHYYHYYFYYYY